jgi:hypothetical protein
LYTAESTPSSSSFLTTAMWHRTLRTEIYGVSRDDGERFM